MSGPLRFRNPKGLAPPPGYSYVVEAVGPARIVYFAGQLGLDIENKFVGTPGDFRAQCVRAFENMTLALQAAGARWSDVVKINNFLVGIESKHGGVPRGARPLPQRRGAAGLDHHRRPRAGPSRRAVRDRGDCRVAGESGGKACAHEAGRERRQKSLAAKALAPRSRPNIAVALMPGASGHSLPNQARRGAISPCRTSARRSLKFPGCCYCLCCRHSRPTAAAEVRRAVPAVTNP